MDRPEPEGEKGHLKICNEVWKIPLHYHILHYGGGTKSGPRLTRKGGPSRHIYSHMGPPVVHFLCFVSGANILPHRGAARRVSPLHSHASGEIYWRIFSNLFCQYLLYIIVHANYLILMSEKCQHHVVFVVCLLTS